MSRERLESIAEVVKQDPAWTAKFSSVETREEWLDVAVEAARAHGFETTAAEIDAHIKQMAQEQGKGERELTVDELAAVTGGLNSGIANSIDAV